MYVEDGIVIVSFSVLFKVTVFMLFHYNKKVRIKIRIYKTFSIILEHRF